MRFPHIVFFVMFVLICCSSQRVARGEQLVITSDLQYEYAQTLFLKEDYDTAMVELKRFIHFFPKSEQKQDARFKIGVCLFHLKKYREASRAFNEIILSGKEDMITNESIFLQSRAFLKMDNIGYAQIVLQNYLKITEDQQTKNRLHYNLAKIHILEVKKGRLSSLASARDSLLKISDQGALKYKRDQHLDLLRKAQNVPQKNPAAAGFFAIIPGGGFLYCERYQDAFVTFLLNTGLILAAVTAYDDDNPALAGVLGFVETGFYAGNIYGSISSAHKYNRAQIFRILGKEFSITSKFDLMEKGYGLSFNYMF